MGAEILEPRRQAYPLQPEQIVADVIRVCGEKMYAVVARLQVGLLDITESWSLETLEEAAETASWEQALLPTDVAALDLGAITAARDRALDFLHGRSWRDETRVLAGNAGEMTESGDRARLVRVYDEDGAFLGLAQETEDGWQPRLAIPPSSPTPLPASRS